MAESLARVAVAVAVAGADRSPSVDMWAAVRVEGHWRRQSGVRPKRRRGGLSGEQADGG
jgi:hypothetical protein